MQVWKIGLTSRDQSVPREKMNTTVFNNVEWEKDSAYLHSSQFDAAFDDVDVTRSHAIHRCGISHHFIRSWRAKDCSAGMSPIRSSASRESVGM